MEWNKDISRYPAYLGAKLRSGRGLGRGSDYLPWYTTKEVPSRGTSDNPTSIRNKRRYELLSDLETLYFFLLERKPDVIDVREQYPILDIAGTSRICSDLGLPVKRRQHNPEPFTIDFLVTEHTGTGIKERAASIKPAADLLDEDTRLKLEVEHRWCNERGLTWEVIDFSSLEEPSLTLSALRFIRQWHAHRHDADNDINPVFRDHFLDQYERNVPLAELLRRTAKRLRIKQTLAEDAFRYEAWVGEIAVSLNHEIALNRPLVLMHEV